MANPNIVSVQTIRGMTTVRRFVKRQSIPLITNASSSQQIIKVNSLFVTHNNTVNTAITNVSLTLTTSGGTVPLVSNISIPVGATFVPVDNFSSIYIGEGESLNVFASSNDRIMVICSYEQISDSSVSDRNDDIVETLSPIIDMQATGGTITDVTIGGLPFRQHTFNYTGADQTFSIQEIGAVTEVQVKMWGAAGGGNGGSFGAAGGFSSGSFVPSINNFRIVVGAGGRYYTTAGVLTPLYGGGGASGGSYSGEGGGYAGLFLSTTPYLIAGGGGGTSSRTLGGAGGGTNGENGTNSSYVAPTGGTQTSGGAGGQSFVGQSGSAYQGGNGYVWSSGGSDNGGGGGAGYFGGGGGSGRRSNGGGGGSGYINTAVITNGVTTTGSTTTPANSADPDRPPTAAIGTGQNGGNAVVIVRYRIGLG